jgi:hypothetical protein
MDLFQLFAVKTLISPAEYFKHGEQGDDCQNNDNER